MKTPDWIFRSLPFLFPKKKKETKVELERFIQERWKVVTKRLRVEGVSEPRLKFWLPGSRPFYRNGAVYLSYSIILKSTENQITTLDHEITHHIQHSRNSHIRMTYSVEFLSFFYWCLTGKLRFGLANRSFQEGFATYVAYLTSGKLPKKVENGKTIVQNGKRLKMLFKDAGALPYVLGGLAYAAIAETKPEDEVLQLGLSANVRGWVLSAEAALSKLP